MEWHDNFIFALPNEGTIVNLLETELGNTVSLVTVNVYKSDTSSVRRKEWQFNVLVLAVRAAGI
jgi:hypothetical protein